MTGISLIQPLQALCCNTRTGVSVLLHPALPANVRYLSRILQELCCKAGRMLTWRRTVFWSGLRRACLAHTPFMTFSGHTGPLMQTILAPN